MSELGSEPMLNLFVLFVADVGAVKPILDCDDRLSWDDLSSSSFSFLLTDSDLCVA